MEIIDDNWLKIHAEKSHELTSCKQKSSARGGLVGSAFHFGLGDPGSITNYTGLTLKPERMPIDYSDGIHVKLDDLSTPYKSLVVSFIFYLYFSIIARLNSVVRKSDWGTMITSYPSSNDATNSSIK